MFMLVIAVLAADPKPLNVGLVASTGDKGAQEQATALAGFIGRSLGVKTAKTVLADYDALAGALVKGEVDVALMGPIAYVRAESQAKVTPMFRMVRKGHSNYRAVIYAKAGSPLKSLEVLKKAKNLKVAWVDPSSATGYVLPKAMLMAAGIDPAGLFLQQDFAGNHKDACLVVVEGKYDVGATFADDPAPAPPKANGCEGALGAAKAFELTIVAATEAIPNDVLVARAGFPPDLAARLTAAAKALAATDEGKKVLAAAFVAEGVTTVAPQDFASVRSALESFGR
jgi:phosphate/phosphite/phosphonate ABC transporter binding protein